MRFSTLGSPSRLALMLSLPMILLFVVASAVFAKVGPQVPFITLPSASEASISTNDNGYMTGTITDENGSPLPDIEVLVFSNEGGWLSSVNTDENGRYDVAGLYTGSYKVCFYDLQGLYSDECYDDMPDRESATLVPVTGGETTTGIDAVLGDGGHITGTITDSDGNPLSSIGILVQRYNSAQEWEPASGGFTDSSGQYKTGHLHTGKYRVRFYGWNNQYLSEYYDNAPNLESATDITVIAEQTTAGIDAVLSLAHHIYLRLMNSSSD